MFRPSIVVANEAVHVGLALTGREKVCIETVIVLLQLLLTQRLILFRKVVLVLKMIMQQLSRLLSEGDDREEVLGFEFLSEIA